MFRFRIPFALFILCLFHASAPAQTETILQTFGYFPQGLSPCGTLIRDSSGDLYGTTLLGGATDNGVVFERGAGGKYKVLYSFLGAPDAAQPNAGVTEDAVGNLYGTTTFGGVYDQGAIYKLTPGGAETVLYSFTGGADGAKVYGGVTLDPAGNLYGTAAEGGSMNGGVVWEFSAAGQFTVLHAFAGFPVDGANPYAGVTLDAQGNLYGTTSYGGTVGDLGTVFKLSPGGAIALLHTFTTIPQAYPQSGLAIDSAGNLYGGLQGAVYEVSASGVYTQFALPRGADVPVSGAPALDGAGNLYVVTGGRGTYLESGGVFQVNLPSGQSSKVYVFPGPPTQGAPEPGGVCPSGNMAAPGVATDAAGNLYGSSQYFGLGGGLFEIAASTGAESTLYRFPASPGGSMPNQIVRNLSGRIFGITQIGGAWNGGALYELAAGTEHTIPLPVAVVSPHFGQDSAGNFYVCGGAVGDQSDDVYKIAPSGQSTLLYTFTDGSNCLGVTADAGGDVYGITLAGVAPQGQVFRVSNTGEFTSLYVFSGGSDGALPNPELTLDKKGNVYGVTSYGGIGAGVIFKVTPDGTETVLHTFISETGGLPVNNGVTIGPNGSIYGATTNYGLHNQGVVYALAPSGQYRVLYSFTGKADGGDPTSGVALDSAGDIYGTTSAGGAAPCVLPYNPNAAGCGVLFEVTAAGSYTVLHTFTAGSGDGGGGFSTPVLDAAGNVYGSATYGGPSGYGVIYEVSPSVSDAAQRQP